MASEPVMIEVHESIRFMMFGMHLVFEKGAQPADGVSVTVTDEHAPARSFSLDRDAVTQLMRFLAVQPREERDSYQVRLAQAERDEYLRQRDKKLRESEELRVQLVGLQAARAEAEKEAAELRAHLLRANARLAEVGESAAEVMLCTAAGEPGHANPSRQRDTARAEAEKEAAGLRAQLAEARQELLRANARLTEVGESAAEVKQLRVQLSDRDADAAHWGRRFLELAARTRELLQALVTPGMAMTDERWALLCTAAGEPGHANPTRQRDAARAAEPDAPESG